MTTAPPSPHRPGDDDDPTGVRALLSSLPDPGPMPEDLVARISAALDAESTARTVAPASTPADEGTEAWADVVPLSGARRVGEHRRSWRPLLAAAAGVAVLGGAGAFAATHLPQNASTASAALGASSPASTAGSTTGSAPAGPSTAGPGDVQIRLSGTSVSAASLGAYGSSLLATTWTPATPLTVEQPGVGPIGTPQGVLECLAALHADPGQRVAAEIGHFGTSPAVIIATRVDGAPRTYAVALPCAPGNARLLAGPTTSPR